MSLLHRLAAAFGLVHDKEQALRIEKQKQPKSNNAQAEIGEDLQLGAMGLEVVTTDENGAINWKPVKSEKEYKEAKKGERLKYLTESDKELILAEKLDLVKAQEIKQYWAVGDIGYHAAAKLINKDGFKATTIRPYWTIFNKVHNS